MAYRFVRPRVRIKVDTSIKYGAGAFKNVIDAGLLQFARASSVQFEIGLFYRDTLVDISNIASATMEIHQTSLGSSSLAMTKTISAAGMRVGLTQDEWDSGEPDKCHFLFSWLSTETPDSVFGTPGETQQHLCSLWGYSTDATVDVDSFAAATIQSFNAGIMGTTVSPPVSGTGVTMEQLQSVLGSFAKLVNDPNVVIVMQSPDGTKRRIIGVDNNGDLIDVGQANT